MMTAAEFEKAYTELKNLVCWKILQFGFNECDVDDIYQEVFTRIWRYRHLYADQGNLAGFVVRIATNYCIDARKKFSRRVSVFTTLDQSFVDACVGQQPLFYEKYSDEVQAALDKVPNKYKEPFLLYLEGDMYKDIAEKTEKSVGTIAAKIYRAKECFVKNYQKSDRG